jgi:hypothetical protein
VISDPENLFLKVYICHNGYPLDPRKKR